MIDVHLHVLPGIDDGSSSFEISASMLASLAGLGVTRIVATPHLMEPLTADYQHLAMATLDALQPEAASHGVAIGLGYEHLLVPSLAERLEAGEQSTMAGSSAVLVELPFVGWPQHAESSLFALRMAGYVPILAHPERYLEVQKDPELAIGAGERGAVLQLTSGSFAGVYGKAVERSARTLIYLAIERDVPFILASDAHSDGQRLARVPAGLEWIRSHVAQGDLAVEWSSTVLPSLLLRNAPLPSFAEWASTALKDGRPDRPAPDGTSKRRRWLFRTSGGDR